MTECEICKEKLEEFESKKLDCGHYTCNRCAYEVRGVTNCLNCYEKKKKVEEKLPFYCIWIDGENLGYCTFGTALELIEESIAGTPEETIEIVVKRKMMTPQDFDELEEG